MRKYRDLEEFYLKKSWKYLSIIALSALLVGCSDKETSTEPVEPNETVTENQTISIEEFLKKVNASEAEITSFATDIVIATTTEVDGKEEKLPLNMSMKVTLDPLRVKQFIDMDLRDNGLGRIKNESYMQDGFIYIKHPEKGTWVKSAIPNYEQAVAQSLNQSPAEQLKLVTEHLDLFTLKETDESYQLTFKGTKEDINALLEGQLESLIGNNTLPINPKEPIVYEEFTYDVFIDKQTFFPLSLDLKATVQTTIDNETIHTGLEMNATYRDVNAVEAIELPEEAKNAKEPSQE